MLQDFSFGNFKAFGETQTLPVRPITLVFGANSTGKSSIIHALLLARHALDGGDLDATETSIGGKAVDLGGFRQYVYRRESARRVELAATLQADELSSETKKRLGGARTVTVSVQIGLSQEEGFRLQRGVDKQGNRILAKVPSGELVPTGVPFVQSFELLADGRSLFRMSRRSDGLLRMDRLETEHPAFRATLEAIVLSSTTTEALSEQDWVALNASISELVPQIAARARGLLPEGLAETGFTASSGSSIVPVAAGDRQAALGAALRTFFPRLLDELIRGTRQAFASILSHLQYLGPYRSFPPRFFSGMQSTEPDWFAGGGDAWNTLLTNERVRKDVNRWLGSEFMQTRYELQVRSYANIEQVEYPIMELLEPMEPSDEESEVEPRDLHLIADLLRGSPIDKREDLVLVDLRTNTPVSHRDVGFGVSQVLPVLVRAFASEGSIQAMEQPEIHLHPALQAEIGDVFLRSALEHGNTFLLETHSEHLILRIMRRMRETWNKTLPKDLPPVVPADVSILYVEPGPNGAVVREMPLNERGELVKAWPGGFFEEGLREVLP
jgi:hypothetical protein